MDLLFVLSRRGHPLLIADAKTWLIAHRYFEPCDSLPTPGSCDRSLMPSTSAAEAVDRLIVC
jgi:hypothetical protein